MKQEPHIVCQTGRGLLMGLILFAVAMGPTFGETAKKNGEKPGNTSPAEAAKGEKTEKTSASEPVVTHHAVTVHGKRLKYTATAGYLQLVTEPAGKPTANMFFVAYELEHPPNPLQRGKRSGEHPPGPLQRGKRSEKHLPSPPQEGNQRPVAFAFNGGPGSSAIWLHMGALGPRRVELGDEGTSIPKSYELVDNDYTWLEFTDLVFIDPVGTGFSRAVEGVDAKKFYNPEGDIDSTGSFIRQYVTKYGLWMSPKILIGESYGTTRAAGLLNYLQTKNGMNFNAVVLISSALNFQAILYEEGNDLPYMLAVPSLTATSLYHHKLEDLAAAGLDKTLAEVEHWSMTEYAAALAKGDGLTESEQRAIAEQLVKYTGLPMDFVLNNRLRVSTFAYIKQLMRNEHRTLGLLDGRVMGVAVSPESEYARVDPALFVPTGPFVATFNAYVEKELKYTGTVPYEFLSMEVNGAWKWSATNQGYLNVSSQLKEAITLNDRLRVFLASGLYDLTCPYLSQEYMRTHLGLEPALRDHVTSMRYDSGHQIYTSRAAREKLTEDVAAFLGKALGAN